ncbi:MAG: hypothetical protein QM820_10980 [Minicystis sp.]
MPAEYACAMDLPMNAIGPDRPATVSVIGLLVVGLLASACASLVLSCTRPSMFLPSKLPDSAVALSASA